MVEKTQLPRVWVLGTVIHYSDIYSTRRNFGGVDKFGVSFNADQVPPEFEEYDVRTQAETGLYTSSSNFKPLVAERRDDYDTLIKALAIADARNIERNMLFKEINADVVVNLFKYDNRQKKGTGLGIIEVRIDATELLYNAMNYEKP